MSDGDVLLTTDPLTVGHGSTVVLRDVRLSLRAGEITVLIGPNGCGKSTLLRTVAGLLPPIAGEVRVGEHRLTGMSRRALAREIAFLPQSAQVPAGVSVRDLVRHGRYAHRGAFGRHTAEDVAAIDWALEVTDAAALASQRLDELSGGERQRAWLATVLAQRAGVLLLDEPTTYLDLRHQFEVLDVLRKLVREHHIACGVVLHDLAHAAAYADRVLVVANGAVLANDAPDEVLTSDAIEAAFGLRVRLIRDAQTGHLACFPDHPIPVGNG